MRFGDSIVISALYFILMVHACAFLNLIGS